MQLLSRMPCHTALLNHDSDTPAGDGLGSRLLVCEDITLETPLETFQAIHLKLMRTVNEMTVKAYIAEDQAML